MDIKKAIATYELLKESKDVHNIVKHFVLPSCDYSVRLAHKIWARLLLINSYSNGVVHLNNNKYPALANSELTSLNEMLEALKEIDLPTIHKQLSQLDKIFDTTH